MDVAAPVLLLRPRSARRTLSRPTVLVGFEGALADSRSL